MKEIKTIQKNWVKHFVAITDNIIDFKLIELAIKKLDISKQAKSKIKCNFKNILLEKEKNGNDLYFNNIEKLNEIFMNLGFKDVEI